MSVIAAAATATAHTTTAAAADCTFTRVSALIRLVRLPGGNGRWPSGTGRVPA